MTRRSLFALLAAAPVAAKVELLPAKKLVGWADISRWSRRTHRGNIVDPLGISGRARNAELVREMLLSNCVAPAAYRNGAA